MTRSTGCSAMAAFACAALVVIAADTPRMQSPPPSAALNPQFEQLVDRYLQEVRGVGGRSAAADMGAPSFAAQLDAERAMLRDLQAIDRKSLNFDQEIDYRFLESILKGDIT